MADAAERQRLHYARKRDGLIVLPVLVVEDDVTAILEADGLIPPGTEPTRAQVADALSGWLFRTLTRERNRTRGGL
jgi:hypothetical protein